ncbi:hypothetical protein DFH29DRAFT_246157 [Suillus ampliporus]|nr:hypothetical protein DFH29DRAFT_246157 [Suillus ampliporus]
MRLSTRFELLPGRSLVLLHIIALTSSCFLSSNLYILTIAVSPLQSLSYLPSRLVQRQRHGQIHAHRLIHADTPLPLPTISTVLLCSLYHSVPHPMLSYLLCAAHFLWSGVYIPMHRLFCSALLSCLCCIFQK